MVVIISMTIVDISPNTTYKLLKKVKKIMKEKNPLFKVNNDTTIQHALKKVEEAKDYEIKLTD
jgi:hypothetical protein